MFKTELHTHSKSVSNCSTMPENDLVRRYIAAGYTTVFLTNHLSRFTYKNDRIDISGWSWDKKIDYYMNGFHLFEAAAVGRINTLMGVELRSNLDDNDYLIYGVDEQFLRSMPEILDTKVLDVANAVRDYGGIFIQAHPFRNAMRVTKPDILDGVEVYNGHPAHDSRNDIANMWAEKYNLIKTSGTDFHHARHVAGAGILTDEPITTTAQLVSTLRSGKYELIRAGAAPY